MVRITINLASQTMQAQTVGPEHFFSIPAVYVSLNDPIS
jgi:hypothetical protein